MGEAGAVGPWGRGAVGPWNAAEIKWWLDVVGWCRIKGCQDIPRFGRTSAETEFVVSLCDLAEEKLVAASSSRP